MPNGNHCTSITVLLWLILVCLRTTIDCAKDTDGDTGQADGQAGDIGRSGNGSGGSATKRERAFGDNFSWLHENLELSELRQSPVSSATTDTSSGSSSNQPVQLYKQPNGWLFSLVREFFDDIDWQAIENAREQIEKFIRKVDRLVGSFRSIISRVGGSGSGSTSGNGADGQQQQQLQQQSSLFGAPRLARSVVSPKGRWWTSSGGKPSAGVGSDATSIKGMLERVACFVGYVRLMNLSNDALAELDASKVVSNLFSAGARRNSSSTYWQWLG